MYLAHINSPSPGYGQTFKPSMEWPKAKAWVFLRHQSPSQDTLLLQGSTSLPISYHMNAQPQPSLIFKYCNYIAKT